MVQAQLLQAQLLAEHEIEEIAVQVLPETLGREIQERVEIEIAAADRARHLREIKAIETRASDVVETETLVPACTTCLLRAESTTSLLEVAP